MIRVTVWYEYTQESGDLRREFVRPDISEEDFHNFSEHIIREAEAIRQVYPEGLMAPVIRELAADPQLQVTYTTMYDAEFGLPDDLLEQTDVLIWWAHICHDAIPDSLVQKIVARIQKGMGFIALHSAHKAKPFMQILGTSCTLRWRNDDFCRVWNTAPLHPIAQGLPEYFELPGEEMYGECFDIPNPEDVVFMSWFRGGELFRSGCTWRRGYGRIFYFQPGHETTPAYHDPNVLRIIHNAVLWAAPVIWREDLECPNILIAPEQKQ